MLLRNLAFLNAIRVVAATFVVACLIVPAGAQDDQSQPKGVPDDWSHHHVIFSDPGTMQDALANGTYEHWYQITSNPRFQMQKAKRQAACRQVQETGAADGMAELSSRLKGKLKRDWSVTLGGGGVAATMYPAKYTFDTGGPPSCTDYAVFPANVAGGGTAASGNVIILSDPGTWGTGGNTVTIAGIQYTFVTTTPAAANSFMHTGGTNTGIRTTRRTTCNAVINNDPSLCTDTSCVFSGQTRMPALPQLGPEAQATGAGLI